MKRKQKQTEETEVSSQLPPWEQVKTRELAWRAGFSSGLTKGDDRTRNELRHKSDQLEQRRKEVELSALKDICQAGSSVVECMTKALMSVNRNL